MKRRLALQPHEYLGALGVLGGLTALSRVISAYFAFICGPIAGSGITVRSLLRVDGQL
jgi:hypothetical protein